MAQSLMKATGPFTTFTSPSPLHTVKFRYRNENAPKILFSCGASQWICYLAYIAFNSLCCTGSPSRRPKFVECQGFLSDSPLQQLAASNPAMEIAKVTLRSWFEHKAQPCRRIARHPIVTQCRRFDCLLSRCRAFDAGGHSGREATWRLPGGHSQSPLPRGLCLARDRRGKR